MIWPFKKKTGSRASPEAEAALVVAKGEVDHSRRLRESATVVRKAADETRAHNHFGLSVAAAMGGKK